LSRILSRISRQTSRRRSKAKPKAKRKPAKDSAKTNGRETLLKVARHLFGLHGLSGVSIRDIAGAANTNSSQISYYFSSKEGLYRACLADIAENRLKMAEQILAPPSSKEEYSVRLRLFAENLISYFLEDRDTGLMIIREYDRQHSPAEDIFHSYISNIFEVLQRFFQRAQKNRYTEISGHPLVATSLFFSMLTNELRIDHLRDRLYGKTLRNPKFRQALIEQVVEFLA
jgi:AcrR family transcriptional regulator